MVLLEERLYRLARGKGGLAPYDYLLLFKILILQRCYSLWDDQIKYRINGGMSFMRFLYMTIAEDISDSKTVWNFREQLMEFGIIWDLFNLFKKKLTPLNLIVHEGCIVDVSFVGGGLSNVTPKGKMSK